MKAGSNWSLVAARRTRLPERVTDWRGSVREMKDGWRRRRWRGGSGGRACQVDEIGSKEENWSESELKLVGFVGNKRV